MTCSFLCLLTKRWVVKRVPQLPAVLSLLSAFLVAVVVSCADIGKCRQINGFKVCEIPHDVPPLPFDEGVPVDKNISRPSDLLFDDPLPSPPHSPSVDTERQLRQQSAFQATILGAPSRSHRQAIEFCMLRAADSWASSIQVTVRVNFSTLGGDLILGTAQPSRNWVINDYICPVALAEAIVGDNLNERLSGTAQYDILMTLNTETNWHVGLDADPPTGQYDLVTVCLHEIYHGLFMSGGNIGVSVNQVDLSYYAIFLRESVTGRFDSFMANQDGCNITAYTDNPTDLGTVLTGNNLWFVSESQRVAKLYAPRPYTIGSSLYHLSETLYGADSDNNDLMTPAIGTRYGQHNPGPIVLEMQRLVLDIEGRRGADACEIVNAPEIDDTPIEQITGEGGNSDRSNFGSGAGAFNLWIYVGAGAGGLVLIIVAMCVAWFAGICGTKKKQDGGAVKRHVAAKIDFVNGGNAGGIV